jgi:hypothetical protein
MLIFKDFGKRKQSILKKLKVCGFIGFESWLQNCFWNYFSFSGGKE